MNRLLKSYTVIVFAGILYAIALKYFILPSKVILTGTEGIATALSYYFESFNLFIVLYVIFQALLLVFAFTRISKVFALRSLVVVSTVVLTLLILPEQSFARPEPQNERIILVIFGGLLAGVAKALAFKNRGSTGDEDIIGAYYATKHLKPVGSIAVIASVGSTAFGLIVDFLKNGEFESVVNTLMYTCLYIFVSTETLNDLYHKFKITMLAIITHQRDAIGQAICDSSSHRTYSAHPITGGRSGDSYYVVRTIITQEELPPMITSIQAIDPDCFYYYHDVEGVSSQYYITPIG